MTVSLRLDSSVHALFQYPSWRPSRKYSRRKTNPCVKYCRVRLSASSQPAAQTSPALVTFVTAGYPKVEDTVPILLSMQEGGADIIELGVPFSDPIADGPAIQETNVVRTQHALATLTLNFGTECIDRAQQQR